MTPIEGEYVAKLKELIRAYQNGMFPITCSNTPASIDKVLNLIDEIDSLEVEIKEQEVTDADIKKAAADYEFAFETISHQDLIITYIAGATNFRDGEIKHVKK